MKILYVSNRGEGDFNRTLTALREIYKSSLSVIYRWHCIHEENVIERIFNKAKFPLDLDGLNRRLYQKVLADKPDVIFIPKGNYIFPKTLRKIKKNLPNIKIVSWSLDDMHAWHNKSMWYHLGLKYYDLVVTTKSYNVPELKNAGAKNVFFVNQAYSEEFHYPIIDNHSSDYSHDILFIGHYEKERWESIKYLAKNDLIINVYGPGWSRVTQSENVRIHNKVLVGLDYSRAISSSKITLCFLRKINRDLHTSRSIEIPACKGFMLAERTDEHIELFEEDKEASYFSSDQELLEKTKFYLANNSLRNEIAQRGYERCLSSKYSYKEMFEKIFNELVK